MSKVKPLSAKQHALIDDLFGGRMEESEMLKKHSISRKLYDRWLADEDFKIHLDRRIVWEYRRSEFVLARSIRVAASNLVRLTECESEEVARKSCIDIFTMQASILADTCSSGSPVLPGNNPKLPPESSNFTHETAEKILAMVAERQTA